MDSSVSHAAEDPGDELAGRTSRKRRSRSPSVLATTPAVAEVQGGPLGDMPKPVLKTAPPAPVEGTPGDAADSAGGASGGERDPKRRRAKSPSTSAAADAPPAIVLSPEIAGMFDLTSLDAEPLKKGLVAHCLTEISGNRVGAILLGILGKQLGQYNRFIRAYSEAITQLKPHATDAFFANLNRQITELSASATAARGSAAARGGRAGRIVTPQSRFTIKVETLKKLIGDEVAEALASFIASPVVVSMISRNETCFNYIGSIPLFQSHGNLRIGNLCIHLDFNKIHVFGGQPSSLTSCLGGINPQNGKVEVGMHFAPYYLTIAHELIHTKHFLQSIGADIEYATQSVRRICDACVAKGSTVGLRDVFPAEVAREVQSVPLEQMSYLQALNLTDYASRAVEDRDSKLLTKEDEIHKQFLTEDDKRGGVKYPLLWNNLEERRTVVGPDVNGISELTLRLAADIPMRYLYQETDRHLFEDPEIINGILERNNSEQVRAMFEGSIILGRVLEVSRKHAAAFIFKRFYALA